MTQMLKRMLLVAVISLAASWLALVSVIALGVAGIFGGPSPTWPILWLMGSGICAVFFGACLAVPYVWRVIEARE